MMNKHQLLEAKRKQRHTEVTVGNVTIICRRPTDMEVMLSKTGAINQHDVLLRFAVGWRGMKQSDFMDGGTDEELPFDIDLYAEWLADCPSAWTPISDAIAESYKLHQTKLEDAGKNFSGG